MAWRSDGFVTAQLKATWPQVLAWRMRRQLLDPIGELDVVGVVRRLCGVQAQLPGAAALAIRVRQQSSPRGGVDSALEGHRLMRTWAMRGTRPDLEASCARAGPRYSSRGVAGLVVPCQV